MRSCSWLDLKLLKKKDEATIYSFLSIYLVYIVCCHALEASMIEPVGLMPRQALYIYTSNKKTRWPQS